MNKRLLIIPLKKKKYNQHPSILEIKQYVTIDETTIQEFQVQIESLDPKKATLEDDIPS